jgi:hypothetical protein
LLPARFDTDTAWTEWRWHGTHADGSRLKMAGVIVMGVRNASIAWARLYVEPVDAAGGGIDAASREMSGREREPSLRPPASGSWVLGRRKAFAPRGVADNPRLPGHAARIHANGLSLVLNW